MMLKERKWFLPSGCSLSHTGFCMCVRLVLSSFFLSSYICTYKEKKTVSQVCRWVRFEREAWLSSLFAISLSFQESKDRKLLAFQVISEWLSALGWRKTDTLGLFIEASEEVEGEWLRNQKKKMRMKEEEGEERRWNEKREPNEWV